MRPSSFLAQSLRTPLRPHRAPLLSFTKEPPLHRYHHRASSPRCHPACAFLRPSSDRYHRISTFRPRRFSRPRRLTPHGASQVYCTLLPVMGSAQFPDSQFLLERPANASPPPCVRETPAEALIPLFRATLYGSSPSSEDHAPLPKKLERMNSFLPLGRIHPSKLSPQSQPYQGHHVGSCRHDPPYHHLAYPSRCCSVRLSPPFHRTRFRFRLSLVSRSPRSTTRA